jgi:hypothetical protein
MPPLTTRQSLSTMDVMNRTVVPTPIKSAALRPRIAYRNTKAVKEFLACHPEIEDFVNASWPALVQAFQGSVDVILELLSDPEGESDAHLVGWIQSTDDIQTGLEKLEQFEDEWFLDHMAAVDNKFNYNIETK